MWWLWSGTSSTAAGSASSRRRFGASGGAPVTRSTASAASPRTRAGLLTQKQQHRLAKVFTDDRHVAFEVAWSVYQNVIDSHQAEQPAEGKKIMTRLISSLQSGVPTGLEELRSLGQTMKRRLPGSLWMVLAESQQHRQRLTDASERLRERTRNLQQTCWCAPLAVEANAGGPHTQRHYLPGASGGSCRRCSVLPSRSQLLRLPPRRCTPARLKRLRGRSCANSRLRGRRAGASRAAVRYPRRRGSHHSDRDAPEHSSDRASLLREAPSAPASAVNAGWSTSGRT